jgi:hypothetical protein
VVKLRCVDFLLDIANVPHSAHSAFLFDDRRAGGLGASQLKQDADIWTIACAALLLDSKDPVVRLSAHSQNKTIYWGLLESSVSSTTTRVAFLNTSSIKARRGKLFYF